VHVVGDFLGSRMPAVLGLGSKVLGYLLVIEGGLVLIVGELEVQVSSGIPKSLFRGKNPAFEHTRSTHVAGYFEGDAMEGWREEMLTK
jgi:hypothetical protein